MPTYTQTRKDELYTRLERAGWERRYILFLTNYFSAKELEEFVEYVEEEIENGY